MVHHLQVRWSLYFYFVDKIKCTFLYIFINVFLYIHIHNIDGDVNDLDASIPPISSSSSFLFDLNDEVVVEDDTHIGDMLQGDINQSQVSSTPQISLSNNLSFDIGMF